MEREGSATNPMSTIIRPRQIAGEFKIFKGEGKSRRLLTYITECGHVGTSARFNREEAYQNALRERAKRAVPAARPAPVNPDSAKSAPSLRSLHLSDLCAELERRGYAVVPADEIGLDANGERIASELEVAR